MCESDPSNEWCPPGHGDLYAALIGSGRLDGLLESGYKYMFVSNSDNLGATLDLKILSHFAETDAPFMMENVVSVPRTIRKVVILQFVTPIASLFCVSPRCAPTKTRLPSKMLQNTDFSIPTVCGSDWIN